MPARLDHTALTGGQPRPIVTASTLLAAAAGIGLLLAIVLSKSMAVDGPGLYFALIAIFGGLGMLAAYLYERKNPPTEPEA